MECSCTPDRTLTAALPRGTKSDLSMPAERTVHGDGLTVCPVDLVLPVRVDNPKASSIHLQEAPATLCIYRTIERSVTQEVEVLAVSAAWSGQL